MAGPENEGGLSNAETKDYGYRFDLRNAVGIIISTPVHSVASDGSIVWGTVDGALQTDEKFVSSFQSEMEAIFTESIVDHLGIDIKPDTEQSSHRYFQPPAAQGWPEIALWLWDNALPALGAFDILVSTGRTILEAKVKIAEWFANKAWTVRSQTPGMHSSEESERFERAFTPSITLTPLDIAAVVAVDAYDRLGVRDVLRISVFTRTPNGMGGADHPGPMNSYMAVLEERSRKLAYVSDSSGRILEHFLLSDAQITPLVIPVQLGGRFASTEIVSTVVLEFAD